MKPALPTATSRSPVPPPAVDRHSFMLTGEGSWQMQPDLLGALDSAGRSMVMQRGRHRVFKRGTAIFRQDEPHDGIFLVEDGLVRVFYTAASGREITLAYWMAGSFVGGPEVFGGGTHVWSGVASRDTRALWLGGADMRYLVQRLPGLSLGIIEGLVFKGQCYSLLAQMLGTRSVAERLACVLYRLMQLYGQQMERGVQITSPFTHDDMAHLVGATRQWVSMTLRRLADEGVLEVSRKNLIILRPDWLAAHRDSTEAKGE